MEVIKMIEKVEMPKKLTSKSALILVIAALVGVPISVVTGFTIIPFTHQEKLNCIYAVLFWSGVLLAAVLQIFRLKVKNIEKLERGEFDKEILAKAYHEAMNLPVWTGVIELVVYIVGGLCVSATAVYLFGISKVKALTLLFTASSAGLIWSVVAFLWTGCTSREMVIWLYSLGYRHDLDKPLPGSRIRIFRMLFLLLIPLAIFVVTVAGVATSGIKQGKAALTIGLHILGIGALFFFLTAIIVSLVAKLIKHDLEYITQLSSKIAKGDLTVTAIPFSNSEIGELARETQRLIVGIKDVVSKLKESATRIASATKEVLMATEQQAAGAQEQASAVGEISATIDELNRSMEAISEQSELLMKMAEEASSKLKELDEIGKMTRKGFETIRHKSEQTAENIAKLLDKLKEINKTLDYLNEIAVQTKILAFNAAIEAVSAGEMGRRFSIVASHIKELAISTSKSADDIKNLLQEIESLSSAVVLSVDEEQKEVERRMQDMERLEQRRGRIVETIKESVDASQRIGLAIAQQKLATQQVASAMGNISKVAKEIAAGVSQITNSMEDLNRLAQEMSQIVGRFKLDSKE